MQILNVGSINIDHVYEVDHFVRPGETLSGLSYKIFSGGKGFNQSIALARAGVKTCHLGRIGKDDAWLLNRLEEEGVDTTYITMGETTTGHAVIQVIPSGENAIVLYGGANLSVTTSDIQRALLSCSPGDFLLLQNETSSVAEAIRKGKEHKLRIVFNPAPISPAINDYPLEYVDIFILNETEAAGLTGKTNPDEIRIKMLELFPHAANVLTLGEKGAVYFDANTLHQQAALKVTPVDTTAAGDTFIGFFLSELMQTGNPAKAIEVGCGAAAICVTRTGASESIPQRKELTTLNLHNKQKQTRM